MCAKIYLQTLSKEYRNKLCQGTLAKGSVNSLAVSISRNYQQQKHRLLLAAAICVILTIAMAVLGCLSPASPSGNQPVFLQACAFVLFFELILFPSIYYLIVTRIPRQFARCLEKGYPELAMTYGYESIISGALVQPFSSLQLPFSLYIEDTFELRNSRDMVVTGFAHGLIKKGFSVYLIDKEDPSRKRKVSIVTRIETSPDISVSEAADCHVALRLQNGKDLAPIPGMYLYRQNTSF